MADGRQAYIPGDLFPPYDSESSLQTRGRSPGSVGRGSDTASAHWPLTSEASTSLTMASPFGSGSASGGDDGRGRSGSEGTSSRNPLHLNLGFLKSLTEKRVNREGQEPKKRGPKPDSKPALTRRQELNRQAQRTHRERKELYVKALEQEVMRLRESYNAAKRDKESYAEENRKLKEILQLHGISWQNNSVDSEHIAYGTPEPPGSTSDRSGSYGPRSQTHSFSPSPQRSGMGSSFSPSTATGGQQRQALDYDQIGIDFVLTLERPCMDHMQLLLIQANEDEEGVSGHVLMASCPPESHILNHPNEPWEIDSAGSNTPSLSSLMDLSKRLNLDGEITPVMAWGLLLGHSRFNELTAADFNFLKEELKGKIRCYGFGAVLEEFEVRDALTNVFAAKSEAISLQQTYSQFGAYD